MNYSIQDIQMCMDHLASIFDKVRLVDPIERKVLTFIEDGKVAWEEYFCHKVWNKEDRCENCISIHALQFNERLTKFELVNDELYFIIARPINIVLAGDEVSYFTLEILCKMTDEVFFEAYGRNAFAKKIALVEKKIYEDPLTKVFNRRYFDERMFLYHNQGEPVKEVTFIMVDLHDFKGVNDSFGHAVGDNVLLQTAEVLQSCIRENDSVVRMGGDEFLVILVNCDYKTAEQITKVARDKFMMKEEFGQKYLVTADFGIAYCPSFINTPQCINQLLEEADKNMYLDKNGICLWETEKKEK